jgi:hypothetical protein
VIIGRLGYAIAARQIKEVAVSLTCKGIKVDVERLGARLVSDLHAELVLFA